MPEGGGGPGSAAAARHSRTLHLAKHWLAGSLQMLAYQIRLNRGRGLSLRNKALFTKTLSNLFLFFFLECRMGWKLSGNWYCSAPVDNLEHMRPYIPEALEGETFKTFSAGAIRNN